MADFKIYISSAGNFTSTEVDVDPTLMVFEYTRGKDDIYYDVSMAESMRFIKKASYALIEPLLVNECAKIDVSIHLKCGNSYQSFWTGYFKPFDCTVNPVNCWIDAKLSQDTPYECFDDSLKIEQNLFYCGDVKIVKGFVTTYQSFTLLANGDGVSDSLLLNLVQLASGSNDWCAATRYNLLAGGEEFRAHREVATFPCVGGAPTPIGAGWMERDNDDCGDGNMTFWRCPLSSEALGDYNFGRWFTDFLTTMVTGLDCSLTVKSDFFNINPAGDAPANAAYTYAATFLQQMTVHQKSDIKRHDAINSAFEDAWDIKPDEFFKDLRKIFNVWHIIKDGVLIIEHYSFFQELDGADHTDRLIPLQYDFSGNSNVKTETFSWMDGETSVTFDGYPIIYDCGETDKDIRVQTVTTDLGFIQPDANAGKVSDKGFVIISNYLNPDDGLLYIQDNNKALGFPKLHASLHRDARLFKSGTMNTSAVPEFNSWLPYRKQEPFSVPMCCDEVFDPTKRITTKLGKGRLSKATYNVGTGLVELNLEY